MAINPVPQKENITEDNGSLTPVWIKFFRSVWRDSQEGYTGSFTNGDGDTVTIVNGKITDVS